jgi:hypothetical protein
MSTETIPPSKRSNEEKSKLLAFYLKEAEKHNAWVDKAKHHLLTKLGPKVAKLGKTGYMGCGFHYDMEQRFGRILINMAIPLQPCMNWIDNCQGESLKAMLTRVMYEGLVRDIAKAEKSVMKR